MLFNVVSKGHVADIYCDESVSAGVKRVAKTVAEDIFCVTGKRPRVCQTLADCTSESVVVVSTVGCGQAANKVALAGKRECYILSPRSSPFSNFPHIRQALFITGSDKRGTIYGMFRLSELCGVSPLVFWGDVAPARRDTLALPFDGDVISKEPSVKYRGFFINDEWPAFGKWCHEKFGGVGSAAYDKVFELVLRLKGNYMWPAMWRSSFWEDGPGLENARLADEYGVIMGTSHHEPLCRAGVEWQRQYKNYGDSNDWSFVSNSEAITEFWRDGIKRSHQFENVVTIGMRGENDSKLMENATMQDNINVLKKAITVQNRLIQEVADLKKVPRMLAIYKEVEDFFFGAEGCDGLRGFDEIEDVILLLSDDNYGNLRAIPQPDDAPHQGGYGLYYHFDYHGGPVSNEWLNNTNPVKAWEQLTTAYDYGIREMWIVNVGDIKGNEYPLSFFMDLAYDYERWGASFDGYTEHWLKVQFGDASDQERDCVRQVLDGYVKWSSLRIVESLNPDVFKNNYHEMERAKQELVELVSQAESCVLPESCRCAYESMVYYPAVALFNTVLLNIEAGLNHVHAKRGTLVANEYAAAARKRIELDKRYVNEFHQILNGKWNHMMESAHMGFRTWDDNNWTYPTLSSVSAIPYPKIVTSFRGYDDYSLGHHWQNKGVLSNDELTRPDVDKITLDIDSRGDVSYRYSVSCDKPWLTFSASEVDDSLHASVEMTCARDMLQGDEVASVVVAFDFENGEKKQAFLSVKASNASPSQWSGAFVERQGYVCMNADGFSENVDVEGKGWRVVRRLGREGNAIRCVGKRCGEQPYVRYDFVTQSAGEYEVLFYLSPRNPMVKGGKMVCRYSVNGGRPVDASVVRDDFYTNSQCREWSMGALNKIRVVGVAAELELGLNSIKVYAHDPCVILENIVLHPKSKPVLQTYLSPPVSYRQI